MFQFFLKYSEDRHAAKTAHHTTWVGFLPLAGLPAIVLGFAPTLPAWGFMWLLAGAIFVGCKWLTWWDAGGPQAAPLKSAAYLLCWPGMDARAFLTGALRPTAIPASAWAFAVGKTLFGAALLWIVAPSVYPTARLASGWLGMVGLIFLLHFGIFHILSLVWQRIGVPAQPLMNWPIAAVSLGGFWGERWNRGFNDLAVRHVFRPLCPRVGAQMAMLAAFLVSGMLHDVVISIPTGGGYGLPTLYFLIQAGGLLFERSAPGKRLGLRHGVRGWIFTLAVVAGPVGLLFPAAFIERVMIPFFHFLHAL